MLLQNIMHTETYGIQGQWERIHEVPLCIESDVEQITSEDGTWATKINPLIKEGDDCFVSFYGETMSYGGPEEGGWFYPITYLVKTIPTVYSEDNALKIANYFKESYFDEEVVGDIYSVNGGQRCFIQVERNPGSCENTETQTYE